MKKFIAAFDGLKFSRATLDYSIYLAKNAHAHLVGVFLDDLFYHSYSYQELVATEVRNIDKKFDEWNEEDKEKRDEAVQWFQEARQQAGIEYSVHRNKNVALQDLLHESVYADLLVISNEETLSNYKGDKPSTFLRDLLADVECPVLVVPKNYQPIDNLVLLYDGEPSSVYAIKMFSYLLPVIKHLETWVVTIKGEKDSRHVPDNRLMKEFMKRHFPKAEYHVYKGQPEDQIISFLQRRKDHCLVVLGAYQRSRVSRWFRQSMADYLMENINQPLFIAHNK